MNKPTPITDAVKESVERLDAIAQRLSLATMGPWTSSNDASPYVEGETWSDEGANIYRKEPGRDYQTDVVVGGCQDEQGGAVGVLSNEDAEFIAHARADIEWLLDRLEQAEDEEYE